MTLHVLWNIDCPRLVRILFFFDFILIDNMNRVHPLPFSPPRQIVPSKLNDFIKPVLVRQTNEHERLPNYLLNRWWNSTAEEKKNICMVYDAFTWS